MDKDKLDPHLPSDKQVDDSIFGLAGYFALALVVAAIVNALLGGY